MSRQLSQVLNEKINFSLPLTKNLSIFDSVVSELRISPISHQALAAYQLICKEYIAPRTPSQSSNNPSSPKQSPFDDIDDPEVFTHFSFAKKNVKKEAQYFKEMKPEQLFKEHSSGLDQKKGRSEDSWQTKNSHKNHNKHYVSNFQLPISMKESVAASRCQDVKEASRIRLEQIEHLQEEMTTYLKEKRLNQLLRLIAGEKRYIKKQLKLKSAIFMYKSGIMHKVFSVLKQQRQNSKDLVVKAEEYRNRNNDLMLEEFFIAWKERAERTQIERAFEQQIQIKYEHLCKVRILMNLRSHHKIVLQRYDKLEEYLEHVVEKVNCCRKKQFYSSLSQYMGRNQQFQNKKILLLVNRRCKVLKQFENIMKKVVLFRSIRDKARSEKLLFRLSSRSLIKKLKSQNELQKVYWKNPNKIVLMTMVFEAIKDAMSRKGYIQEWMSQLPSCLERTDKKLSYVNRKFKLAKSFQAFTTYLYLEKQKMAEVKAIQGQRILKQLLKNYKISIIKQKEEVQVEQLCGILVENRVFSFFQHLQQQTQDSPQVKAQFIERALNYKKAKQSIKYLTAHKISSKYYRSRLHSFSLRQKELLMKRIFDCFRRATMTEIVNKKIVKEYHNYCEVSQLEVIFNAMKQFTFEEKFLKKRVGTLKKLRMGAAVQKIIFNMRVAVYGRYKKRQKQYQDKVKKLNFKLMKRRVGQFWKQSRKNKLRKAINNQIDQEYYRRFIAKAFFALKIVTENRKKEKIYSKTIQREVEQRVKSNVFDKMISSLLKILTIKSMARVHTNYLLRESLLKIHQFSILEQAVKESSYEDIETISQIKQKVDK